MEVCARPSRRPDAVRRSLGPDVLASHWKLTIRKR